MKALILFHTCPRKPKSNHARSYYIGFKPYRSFHHMQMSIIEKYGLNPDECVFLDDRKDNVEAAVGCGMNGIVAADHDEAAAKLEECLAV